MATILLVEDNERNRKLVRTILEFRGHEVIECEDGGCSAKVIDVVRLGDDQFVDRLQSYLDLAPALRERVENIDYVDLRFDERVYVGPARGKSKHDERKVKNGIPEKRS